MNVKDENQDVEGDIEVEIEADTEGAGWLGHKDEGGTTAKKADGADDDITQYSDTVQKRIKNLTRRYREAERQRDAAAEYARNVQSERDMYRHRADALDKGYVGEYENRINTQLVSAQSELRSAMDNQDNEAAVKAQVRMSELASEAQRVRVVKAQQANRPQLQPQAPYQQQVQRVQPDEKAKTWAKNNDWFGEDRVLTKTALGVHEQLVEDEGYDPTSDDYYAELDKRLEKFTGNGSARTTRRPAQTVAGAGRSNGQDSKGKVRLTRSQVDMARRLGVPLQEYAKYVKQ